MARLGKYRTTSWIDKRGWSGWIETYGNGLDRKYQDGEVTLNIKLGERRTVGGEVDGLFDDYLTNKREERVWN